MKYFLKRLIILFCLIIPNQIFAQYDDTTSYFDKLGQLDYIHYAIKSKPGLRTKHGRLLYRRITKENFRGHYEISLTKDGKEEILWGPKLEEYNNGTEGLIRNYILEQDYFSFILTTDGIEWIICEKQANGQWKETNRTYIEESGGIEGLHRKMTILMPDKKTVTIKVDGILQRSKGILPTKDKYQFTDEKKILKNGIVHELRIHKRIKESKAHYKEVIKKYRINDDSLNPSDRSYDN